MTAFPLIVPRGYRVGAWTVEQPLGAGAFASVYAARRAKSRPGHEGEEGLPDQVAEEGLPDQVAEEGLPDRVALKFLPTGTHTPRQLCHLRELAEREVELLRRLRSPRLIRMFETLTVDDPDLPELDGATVLVLEEAERPLQALLTGAAPPAAGPALLVQVCEGLHQLHTAGWVHGDLKPGNVLLMRDGSVRLGDFSTASELDGTHAYAPGFATPDYTPPELLWTEIGERGVRVRATADVWAFGVLAHLVLTGSLPLPGGTPAARRDAAVRYARGEEDLRLSPELPPAWREIVADCLSRTHAERAAHDADALLRRVTAAAGTARPPRLRRFPYVASARFPYTPRFPYASGASRGRRRRLPLVAAAATAVVTALGFTLNALGGSAEASGYDRCDAGKVCFFSEPDGRGEMCRWLDSEVSWLDGGIRCPWTRERPVRSAYNNGNGPAQGARLVDVAYYAAKNHKEPLGCLERGTRTTFEKPVLPRSHRWLENC
ncbi:protein kinase [Streptomyces sp. NBC_00094]|uniref:protein kinase domain-containing protein n=1 Tax=Streptomyces sp. NBC_00094 TaxID=2903620 RepID=UPI002257F713|nr:protein kinase [Streptomyces sp. NBC_00094]MCX5392686.1 protein kinase [Streptomyces sp. NBC_00094]